MAKTKISLQVKLLKHQEISSVHKELCHKYKKKIALVELSDKHVTIETLIKAVNVQHERQLRNARVQNKPPVDLH